MSPTDSPIIAAAVAVSATIGLAVLVVKEIVLPTHVAAVTYELDSTKKELAAKTDRIVQLEDEKQALSSRINELEKEKQRLSSDLFAAQNANAFVKGSPYPVGLEKIKIGDKIELIDSVYPSSAVRKDKRQVIAETQHAIFVRSYYTHNHTTSTPIVNSIRFVTDAFNPRVDQRATEVWIGESLARSLGPPRMVGEDRDCMFWQLGQHEFVYYRERDYWYWVMDESGYPPGCWPISPEKGAKR